MVFKGYDGELFDLDTNMFQEFSGSVRERLQNGCDLEIFCLRAQTRNEGWVGSAHPNPHFWFASAAGARLPDAAY